MEAGGVGSDSALVCQGGARDAAPPDHRPDKLAIPGRYPRVPTCYGSTRCARGGTAFGGRPEPVLDAMPARQLVLSLVAPDVSHLLRADCRLDCRCPGRSHQLGLAL